MTYGNVIGRHLAQRGDAHLQRFLARIDHASRRLTNTIDAILDFAGIESGSFDVHPKVLALGSMVESRVEKFRKLAEEKGLSIESSIEMPHAAVLFDEYCLRQAIDNLLSNSIKFTFQGTVSVRLYRNPSGPLVLEIRDTGIGIAKDYLPNLFKPFSQEESGYQRPFEGSGLGLALVKNYLGLNGAQLNVESEKGQGSIFTITFSTASEVVISLQALDASQPHAG